MRLRRGADGADLARVPLDDAEKRWGAPYIAVHRADLLAALVDRARGEDLIQISNNSSLTGFIQDEKGVAVTYRFDGEFRRASGAALIGADGVRSMTRTRLIQSGADKPAYTGHTAWRTILPAAGLPEAFRRPAANLWFGERAHLVHYPLRGGSIVNVVALVEDTWRGEAEGDPEFWDNEGDRKFLLNRFKSWCGEARELIGAGETWLRWPLFDRPPLESFAQGRVALLGDAAHPMLPYLAQGAAQAIEDAAALAAAVAAHGDDPADRLDGIFRRPRGALPQDPGRRARPGPDLSSIRRQGLRPRSGLARFRPQACCAGARTGFTLNDERPPACRRLGAHEANRSKQPSAIRLGAPAR